VKIVGLIPARYESSRFPGKPLADIHGLPMICHVIQRAQRATGISDIVVATDDERIRDCVVDFGAQAIMTSYDCYTGTDRVAEAVDQIDADVIVNVQGDEPLVDPAMLDEALKPVLRGTAEVTTLMAPIHRPQDWEDINTVKVVVDPKQRILCFSRTAIPAIGPESSGTVPVQRFKQIGLYAFTRSALVQFAQWKPGPLEASESVELYRFIEHGIPVEGVVTAHEVHSVDTPEDLERVRRQWSRLLETSL